MEIGDVNVVILDNDGVLRREKLQLPGVPELYQAMDRKAIQSVLLSNNSRVTSEGLVKQMRQFGVSDFRREQAMTSAEGAAAWLVEHPSTKRPEDMRVFAVGEDGVFQALREVGLALANDQWNGKKWNPLPTDVVVGFDTMMDYATKMAPAWNAIRHGVRWVHTNGDTSYRNAEGEELPANGAQLAYLASTGRQPAAVIGKPNIGMAEAALHRMGQTKERACIAVVGDNLVEDMGLATRLYDAGWKAEGWLVLTGVTDAEYANDPRVQRIFEDIRAVTQALLSTGR